MGTIPPINSLDDPRNVLTLVTFVTLTLLAWQAIKVHKRCLTFALCLMVFPFLPASNLFFPVGFVVAERVLYLPSMGFCLLMALGLHTLNKLQPFLVKLMVFYLLLVHSFKTLSRNRAWFSNNELFRAAIVVHPNNGKMYNNLATYFGLSGNKSLVMPLLNHTVHVEPHLISAHRELALLLRSVNNMTEATKVLVKLDPPPTYL